MNMKKYLAFTIGASAMLLTTGLRADPGSRPDHPDPPAVNSDESDGAANVVGESNEKPTAESIKSRYWTCVRDGKQLEDVRDLTTCAHQNGRWRAVAPAD